jgi:phage RecT family recombinase
MSVRGAIAKRDEVTANGNGKSLLAVVNQAIERQAAVLDAVLPTYMSRARFEQIALAQIRATKKLVLCFETVAGQTSVLFGVIQAATVGLEIGGIAQECYLIPRQRRMKQGNQWVDGHWEATLQLGYKGVQKLARRDPAVADIMAGVVHEGDTLEHWIDLGGEHFRHYPTGGSDAELTHAYCLIRHTTGGGRAIVLDRAAVHKRRDASESYKAEMRKPENQRRGFWFEWEDEMWRKTAVHAAKHALDLAPEVRRVLDGDGQVQRFDAEAGIITGGGAAELTAVAEPGREHIEVTGAEQLVDEPDSYPAADQDLRDGAPEEPAETESVSTSAAANPETVTEFKRVVGRRSVAIEAAVQQKFPQRAGELPTLDAIFADGEALDFAMSIIEAGR